MTKVLIIEDDTYKAEELIKFLIEETEVSQDCIKINGAYQSGMFNIANNAYDVILLDMSMPTFEKNTRQPGRWRSFGGREILSEMKRKNIKIPTIIVTQFNYFGEGVDRIDDKQLNTQLEKEFKNIYMGLVHYDASAFDWRTNLKEILKNIFKEIK